MPQTRYLLGLGLLAWTFGMPSRAMAVPTPRVVVVSSQQKGGPKIQPQVVTYIERALKKSTTLVPFGSYYSAARAAGLKGNAVFGPESAIPGGRGVGATHVLFVTSTLDSTGRHSRATAVVVANLIVVATGESLFTHHYALSGRRLTASQGALIVAAVNERLAPATVPSPPLATPVAPALSQPRPPPQAPPPILAAPDNRLPPDISQGTTVPEAPAPAVAAAPAPGATADLPAAAPSADVSPEAGAVATPGTATARLDAWRPGFSGALGALIYWRAAALQADAGPNLPCYCAPAGAAQPTFSRLALRADVYPWAFTGIGRWWEGFGLHLDTSIGWPRTNLGNGVITSQASGQVLANLQYRWVLFDAKTAPELLLGLGYSSYSFPLSGAAFPGLGFRSPTVDLGASIPLGTEVIAVVVRTDLMPALTGFGGNNALGTQNGGGFGVHLEAGLRGRIWDFFDLQALFMLDHYSLGYRGPTRLANLASQLNDASVVDRLLGVYLLAGVTL